MHAVLANCAHAIHVLHTKLVPVGEEPTRGGGSSRELFRTFPYTISVNL